MTTTEPTATAGAVRDYVIIGAGPAGLQLAYFLEQAGRDYLVLEAEQVGHFFSLLPRHRRLISNNKVNTGFTDPDKVLRWDWNSLLSADLSHLFTEYTDEYFPDADTLVRYLRDYRHQFGLRVREGTRAEKISREPDGTFLITLAGGEQLRARRVVVATGHTVPHIPDVPGVEHCELYSEMSTDPAEYRNQRVMIVGKGNSGMETAENLFASTASLHLLSPSPVRLAWTTHHVSDVRAVYHNALDSYQLKMQNTVLDARLTGIELLPDGRRRVCFSYSHAHGQQWELVVDRVLLCTGFRFDFGIFAEDCLPATRSFGGRWPAMSSAWESVETPGLYFVGTVMQSRDYKKSFSGFIHGFRYNIRFLSELLAERYHGEQRTADLVPLEPGALTHAIIARADHASSMFQLPAFMADVYLLDDPSGSVLRYRDTTVDYALDHPGWRERVLLIATLEYGHLPPGADPFNFPRDPTDGRTSQFIHPVLRLYVGGELVATHHIPEDLENQWDKEMYLAPCRAAIQGLLERHVQGVPA